MPITLTVVLSENCKNIECQRLIAQLSLLNEVAFVAVNQAESISEPAPLPSMGTCQHGTPLNKPCGACSERSRRLAAG